MDGRNPRHPAHENAFTLLEALVASALFLGVALGVAPLLTGAALQNAAGRAATEGSNHARSLAEEISRLPFDSPRLKVASGEKTFEEYWDEATSGWLEGEPPGTTRWLRKTTVRAFPMAALAGPEPGAFPGGAAPPGPAAGRLKEIQVSVRPGGEGLLGRRGRGVTLRLLRSF